MSPPKNAEAIKTQSAQKTDKEKEAQKNAEEVGDDGGLSNNGYAEPGTK